jgi:hypothetical protein
MFWILKKSRITGSSFLNVLNNNSGNNNNQSNSNVKSQSEYFFLYVLPRDLLRALLS